VDHFAVARARGGPDRAFGLENDHFAAGERKRSGDGEPATPAPITTNLPVQQA